MPLVTLDDVPLGSDLSAPQRSTKDFGVDYTEAPPRPKASTTEEWGSSLRQSSQILSAVASPKQNALLTNPDYLKPQEGYVPNWDELSKDERYAPYIDRWATVTNPAQDMAERAQLDMEARDRETNEARGFWRGLGMDAVASMADPTMLLPGSLGFKAVKGGYRFIRGAADVGLAAGVAIGAQEAGLHATQDMRTWQESASTIAMGMLLGGAIGAGAAGLSRGATREAASALHNLNRVVEPLPPGHTFMTEVDDISARIKGGETVPPSEIRQAVTVAAMRAQADATELTPEMHGRLAALEGLMRDVHSTVSAAPVEDLTRAVRDSFDGEGARLLDEGGIKIVQSVDDLPPLERGVHPDDVRGMFDGSVAHIVADNVSPEDVHGVVLHEIGVHYGMQKMLGDELFQRTVAEVVARGEGGEGAFARALQAVPADTPIEHRAEEALAYLVEHAPENGLVQRVISAVKNFVYQATGGKFVRLSEADYRQLAVSALRQWDPKARADGGLRYAKANRDPTVQRSLPELVDAAKSMTHWKDWYERYQGDLRQLFGTDSDLIQKMLSATSQATGVHGNVTLALKAYKQFLKGEAFDGYLPAVRGNLERIRNEEAIRGQKIGEYGKANEGDADAIAVDRHIAMLFFDTKSPTTAQVASAKAMIRDVAGELGWDAKGVQAALWAYNIVRLGKEPQSYDTFLRAKAAEIQRIRAEHGRDLPGTGGGGQGAGLADGGAVGGAPRGAQAEAGPAGADGVRYSRAVTQTPEFKRWFGDSKVVDDNGEPRVVYHGTNKSFDTFKISTPDNWSGRPSMWFAEDHDMANLFVGGRRNQSSSVKGAQVYPAYLSLKNPLDLRGIGGRSEMTLGQFLTKAGVDGSPAAIERIAQRRLDTRETEFAKSFTGKTALEHLVEQSKRTQPLYSFLDDPIVVEELQKAGYDGVHFQEKRGNPSPRAKLKEVQSDTYAVFSPEQIKSATGNSGAFDSANPDIRYSRSKRVAQDIVEQDGGTNETVAPMARLVHNDKIPTISIKDLVGRTLFPTIADRTAAGALYKGIDGTELKVGIPLLGGPNFPLTEGNMQSGVVWANRGKGITTTKAERAKAGQLMLVMLGDRNMHQSNSTVANAVVETMDAYVRDGRIPEASRPLIDAHLRKTFADAPSTSDPKAFHNWADKLSFEDRKRVAQVLGSKEVQGWGGPSFEKILDATREPEMGGMRWGDGVLVVEPDPEQPLVKLGEDGTIAHPDYPSGLRGKVVGKLKTPLNYEALYKDWLDAKRTEKAAAGVEKTNTRRSFQMGLPSLEVTPELADRMAVAETQHLKNARQARLLADFASDRWRTSGVDVKKGGISPQGFVDAINESPASATLTPYTAKEVEQLVKSGDMRVFQLGEDGRVWFALKKGDPASEYDGLDAKAMGFGPNEVTLHSVVNNEQGVPGIASPAILLKAIKEGATALDAFAVKSAKHPDGFLVDLYRRYGYDVVGRTPFAEKYYDANKLADVKRFWKSTGWKGGDGFPDVVFMKWRGTDAERATFTERYLGSRTADVPARRNESNVAAAEAALTGDGVGRTDGSTGSDAGAAGRVEGSPGALLATGDGRLRASLDELKGLSDTALRNFGLTRADVERILYSRGGQRAAPERIAEKLDAFSKALAAINDPVAFDRLFQVARDVGAAASDTLTQDDLATSGRLARGWQGMTAGLNPILRARTSPVTAVMSFAQRLFEDTLYSGMHDKGLTTGPSAETMIRMRSRSARMAYATQRDSIFAEMIKAGARMSKTEFREAISDAMRNNDTGVNDFVSKAAKMARKEVFDTFADLARQTPQRGKGGNGMMLEEAPKVLGAETYLHRMYDFKQLVENEQAFRRLVSDEYHPRFQTEYATSRTKARAALERLDQEAADLQLNPEERGIALQAIEARQKEIEAEYAPEIQMLEDINRVRRQATQAGERGNREARVRLQEQARQMWQAGGDRLKELTAARGENTRRYRNVSLNFAGMAEASEKIAERLNDIDDAMVRRMDRMVARGQSLVHEFERLSPELRDAKLSDYRTQMAELAARSEKTADQLAKERQKIALDALAAKEKARKARESGGMKGATAGSLETEADRIERESNQKLAEKIAKREAAERNRAEEMNRIARRIEEAESLDPEAQLAEVRRGVDAMVRRSTNAALTDGEKAQRLLDRQAKLDPQRLEERLKAIEGLKRDIERGFYDQWDIKKGGQGVDLHDDAVVPDFRAYADDVADQVYRHITGDSPQSGTTPDFKIPLADGPLKQRVLDISDEKLKPWLVNDMDQIVEHYTRGMAAQIEMTRKFGTPDAADEFIKIADGYAKLRAQVEAAPDAAAARALLGQKPGLLDALGGWLSDNGKDRATKTRILRYLDERKKSDIRDMKAGVEMLLGKYGRDENQKWKDTVNNLGAFNYMRASGSMAISNLTDLLRAPMVHGLTQWMGSGVAPLVSNMKGMKAIKAEGQLAGQIAEGFLHTQQQAWGELGDPYSMSTGLGNWMRKGSDVANKWNGMQYLQNFSQWMGSAMSQKSILEGALNPGKDDRLLRYLGIDAAMQGRIAEQFKAHGETQGQLRIANSMNWTDAQARDAFRAAISKNVDSLTTTKSVGDVPLFANTATGRLVLQFRTYALAANQRVLLRGLQEDHTRLLGSIIAMTAVGAMAAALRSWRGGEDRWKKFLTAAENPGYLIGEGLDASGIFTVPMEFANTVEKLTQPTGHQINPIKTPLMRAFPGRSQQGSSTRFMSRDPVSAMLGPSAGIPMQGAQAVRGNGNAAAQLVPFYSMPGPRELFQAITGDSPYAR